MKIGIPRETAANETRVAATPDSVKKMLKKGFKFCVEKGAGTAAGFPDELYQMEGVEFGDANTAVFLYRPKDSDTYRVIYGDLSVKDSAPEDLPK